MIRDFVKALLLRYRAWERSLPEIPHDGDKRQWRYQGDTLCRCPECGLTQLVSFIYGRRICAGCGGPYVSIYQHRRNEPSKYWSSPAEAAEFYRQRCERMAKANE